MLFRSDLKKGTMTVTDKGEKVRTYDLTHEVCEELESWLGWRRILEIENSYDEPSKFNTQACFEIIFACVIADTSSIS